jgi:GPI mannosyltransferase 3
MHPGWRRVGILFAVLWAFRIINAVFMNDAYLDPDEYWQSLEVAFKSVFGCGYETWEWHMKIRSGAFPSLFIALFSALKYIGFEQTSAIMVSA